METHTIATLLGRASEGVGNNLEVDLSYSIEVRSSYKFG